MSEKNHLKNEILLIPEKADDEREAVANVWEAHGGSVIRVGKFWRKPNFDDQIRITIYGNDTFSLVLGQVSHHSLLSPRNEIIVKLNMKWTKRRLSIYPLEKISRLHFPLFVKPVKPKQFLAGIYPSFKRLEQKTQGLAPQESAIISEVIHIDAEVRAFILKDTICDLSFYFGEGEAEEAKTFIQSFIRENYMILPAAYVIDVAYNAVMGWFVLEFNAAWGAGLNGCDPEKVLPCIRAATVN